MEVRGFEPRTFRMQSGRSTTELHPHLMRTELRIRIYKLSLTYNLNRNITKSVQTGPPNEKIAPGWFFHLRAFQTGQN